MDELIKAKFNNLAKEWGEQTRFHSNLNIIMRHHACRQLAVMGESIISLILEEMMNNGNIQWCLLLQEITGENPLPPKIEDGFIKWNVSNTVEAWINWGINNKYLINILKIGTHND